MKLSHPSIKKYLLNFKMKENCALEQNRWVHLLTMMRPLSKNLSIFWFLGIFDSSFPFVGVQAGRFLEPKMNMAAIVDYFYELFVKPRLLGSNIDKSLDHFVIVPVSVFDIIQYTQRIFSGPNFFCFLRYGKIVRFVALRYAMLRKQF